jgi:predicted nucleic acid-binding Zn ribbon protein
MPERLCPHCQQPIHDDEALLCHFCGESLRRTSGGFMGKMTALKWFIALIVLVVFAVLALGG